MGAFDDLIPGGSDKPAGAFDDLIPKTKQDSPGLISAIKRTGGQMASSAGITAEDVIGKNSLTSGIRKWGNEVQEANPAGVTSFGDIVDKPGLYVKESLGNALPQMAPQAIGGIAGRVVGGIAGGAIGSIVPGVGTVAGAAVGQELVGRLGQAIPTFVQEYGGIREEQERTGVDNKLGAVAAAVPATGIEFALGPQRLLGRLLKGATTEQVKAMAKMPAKEIAKSVAKETVKGGLGEAAEEVVQSPIEKWGAQANPFSMDTAKSIVSSPETWNEALFSGAMAIPGGGLASGGLYTASVLKERAKQDTQTKPEDSQQEPVIPPDVSLTADPSIVKQRIDAMLGLDTARMDDKNRKRYESDLVAAFNEPIGIRLDANKNEVPYTMGEYLDSQIKIADNERAKPMRSSANQQATTRLDQLAEEEAQQHAAITQDLVRSAAQGGALSKAALTGIQTGATQMPVHPERAAIEQQMLADEAAQAELTPIERLMRTRRDEQVQRIAENENANPKMRQVAIADLQRRMATKAQPTTTSPLQQTATQLNMPAQNGIKQLQSQLEQTEPFTEQSSALTEKLQSAVTQDAQSALNAGEMPVYKVTDHVSVAIHPSAQNPGMVQVTRYTKDGVIGDSQYNNVDDAVRQEGLTHKPRIASNEAVAVIDKSIQAESEYQQRKSAAPVPNADSNVPNSATVSAQNEADSVNAQEKRNAFGLPIGYTVAVGKDSKESISANSLAQGDWIEDGGKYLSVEKVTQRDNGSVDLLVGSAGGKQTINLSGDRRVNRRKIVKSNQSDGVIQEDIRAAKPVQMAQASQETNVPQARIEQGAAQTRIANESSLNRDSSWVIRNKETGEVVMETFYRKKVDALNTSKYEAVPIQEYLGSLNVQSAPNAAPVTNADAGIGVGGITRKRSIENWTADELQARLNRADAGESPLQPESRQKIEAELAKRKADIAEEKRQHEELIAKAKRESNAKEKARRAAQVLAEREAAKKAEVDKAAEDFALGQEAPAPVERKVTTEDARGQQDVFAQPVRGEVGASLTKAERSATLKTLIDVYRQNRAPKEFKGLDANGNERYGYAHSPEFFVKSDITGSMVRYYVTLPDGRVAHPTELFSDYTQANIDAALQKEIDAEREQERNNNSERERLLSLTAPTINEANRKFNNAQRFAEDRDSIVPALLTNGELYLRSRPENADKAASLLGEGWRVEAQPVKATTEAKAVEPAAVDAIKQQEKTIRMVRVGSFLEFYGDPEGVSGVIGKAASSDHVAISVMSNVSALMEKLKRAGYTVEQVESRASAKLAATHEQAGNAAVDAKKDEKLKKGTVLYHGTQGQFSLRDSVGTLFLTTSKNDAIQFGIGIVPGHERTDDPRLVEIVVTEDSKVKDINSSVEDALMNDDDVDSVIVEESKSAKSEGYDFVHFKHPSIDGGDMDVWVSTNSKNIAIKNSFAKKEAETKDAIGTLKQYNTMADIDTAIEGLYDGTLSLDDYKAAFRGLMANNESIVAELGKLTKDQLYRRVGKKMYGGSETKPELVTRTFNAIREAFGLRRSYGRNSWTMGPGQYEKYIADNLAALTSLVEGSTDEDLKAFADEIGKGRASRQEKIDAAQDPKTLEDFENAIRLKKAEGLDFNAARMSLTPEQRAEFDRLRGTQTRDERKARADQQKTEVRVAAQTTGAQIVEGTHSKHGYPIWSVQLADRVDGDSYKTLLSTAKRMGGNYVNQMQARMWKTVWGFQFRDSASAEAFMKLAAGDKADAESAIQERRDAFADDMSQSAVERLNEMADRMEERADESLGRERKANTERRARFAASAESAANAEKAMATTMRRIAGAIESGAAQFLDRVRQKAQVEYLSSALRTAKDREIREKYPSYADQEKHRGERPTAEAADYAEFPQYTMMRSDIANLARKLVTLPNMKLLGQRILKVADDTSEAYNKFAKDNLLAVSRFGKADGGGFATFSTMKDAERSIEVSNLGAVAVPVQVKRGEYRIVLSPSEAIKRGIWNGDDRKITIQPDIGAEIVEKLGRLNRKSGDRRGMNAPPEAPWQFENAYNARKRLSGMGIEHPWEFRAMLREFASLNEAPKAADKIKEMERAMIGRKNDGLDFFPTPAGTAQTMIDAAEIKDGMSVLEPSAGMGHIAEQIRESGIEPDVVEFNGDRRELLEAKGFNVVGNDFMEVTGSYDRIIMNPPFSNRRDAEHVQHAYSLLRPSGRLVAIMGEGVFFGSDKKAQQFRDWLEEVGGTSEKLDEGTFMDASLPVNTSTNARMVVIDKPEGDTQDKGVALYSKSDATQPESFPRAEAESRIKSILGDKLGKVLIESGLVTFANKGNEYQGATYKDGSIVLNLDALNADNFDGVFAHEGFHSTIRNLVGEETYSKLMKQLETMHAMSKSAQWVKDANAAIPSDTKTENRAEELAAYSIEQYVNGAKQPNIITRWVESLLSALRTAIIRRLPNGKMKLWAVKNIQPQDLANLAIAGLKAKAREVAATSYTSAGYADARMSKTQERTVRAVNPGSSEPMQYGEAGGKVSIEDFNAFVNRLKDERPIDSYSHKQKIADLIEEIEADWSNGSSDDYSNSFGPDKIYADLHKENDAEYFDGDGDLTDSGSSRYNELERELSAKIAKDEIGEPERQSVSLNKAGDLAKIVHAYLEKLGIEPSAISGSGKSDSKYFSVEINGEQKTVRVSDHQIPVEYQDRSGAADYEIALYDIGDDVRSDGRIASNGITEKEASGRAVEVINSILQAQGREAMAFSKINQTDTPANPDIRYSRAQNPTLSHALDLVSNFTGPSAKTFGSMKNVQTQLHKARKDPEHFGKVFNLAMDFRTGVSRSAYRAWEAAKDILPAYDNIADATKAVMHGNKASKELSRVSSWIFDGTTDGGGNPLDGVRWTPEQLRTEFKATEKEIGLYEQARNAIDSSLIEVANSVAWKIAKPNISEAMTDKVKALVTGNAAGAKRIIEASLQFSQNYGTEAEQESTRQAIEAVGKVYEQAQALIDAGYAPLSRFGRYTVDVFEVGADGKIIRDSKGTPSRLLFQKFEFESEAKAAERQLKKEYLGNPNVVIKRGVQAEKTLFSGVDPETVALFVDQVSEIQGLDIKREVLDEWRRNAVSQRSALMHHIKRKGIQGYSEDLPRVLASFLTSNARYASSNFHMADMQKAISDIPDTKGDVRDEAQELFDYINAQNEPGAWMRGLMFAWYLGGSPAAAAVNLTQPVLMTLPYLSQFGSATKHLLSSVRQAMQPKMIPSSLKNVMTRATEDGLVEAQEIHHLYDAGMKPIIARIPGGESLRARAQGAATLWGAMFGMAENFNRRITFLSAYKMGQEMGDAKLKEKGFADAYEFAKLAVEETQGIYAKENRPNWARGNGSLGAVGVAAFTFKQFSIQYVELLSRMAKSGPEGKKSALLMLGLLVLASGIQGGPGADDLDDLIDTVLQSMGYVGNVKKAKRDFLKNLAGERLADIVMYGLSAETPIDVQSRLGLGNLIPATGAFKPSESNKAGQLAEILGPPGGMARAVGDFVDATQSGQQANAFAALSPVFIRNIAKAMQMAETGEYRDSRGRKVESVDMADAIIKGIGFQPQDVATSSRRAQMVRQDIARVRDVESDIASIWAQGIAEGDKDQVSRARERLADWNASNPQMPIRINMQQIFRRVREMKTERSDRLERAAPRELRGYVRDALN